jgi:hydrogenase maturation protease
MTEVIMRVERSLDEKPDFVQPSTIVVGLGNPILGDDGVGWKVAERVKSCMNQDGQVDIGSLASYPVEVDCLSLGGLRLMERIIGFDRVIIIDAITTGEATIGYVCCLSLDDIPKQAPTHLSSAHDTDLQTAIEVGRSLGAKLPNQVMVVAVEIQINYDFSERLSPEVDAAVPQAEKIVLRLLSEWAEKSASYRKHQQTQDGLQGRSENSL